MQVRRFNTWQDFVEQTTPGESWVSAAADYFGEVIWNAVKLASLNRQSVSREDIVYILGEILNAVESDMDEVHARRKANE